MDMIDHYPANNDWRRELHVRGLQRLLKDLKWRVAVGARFPVFGYFARYLQAQSPIEVP